MLGLGYTYYRRPTPQQNRNRDWNFWIYQNEYLKVWYRSIYLVRNPLHLLYSMLFEMLRGIKPLGRHGQGQRLRAGHTPWLKSAPIPVLEMLIKRLILYYFIILSFTITYYGLYGDFFHGIPSCLSPVLIMKESKTDSPLILVIGYWHPCLKKNKVWNHMFCELRMAWSWQW